MEKQDYIDIQLYFILTEIKRIIQEIEETTELSKKREKYVRLEELGKDARIILSLS